MMLLRVCRRDPLGRGGTFDQDLSVFDIEDFSAIGYLISFWLHTQVSTESELE
jgi:hypothetical protein